VDVVIHRPPAIVAPLKSGWDITLCCTKPSKLAPNEKLVAAALWVIAGLGFALAFWSASAWPFATRLMPQTASTAGSFGRCSPA
jgi:hypothetical protein